MTWDAVRRGVGGLDRRQARWLADLHGVLRQSRVLGPFTDTSEWLVLDESASATAWAQLQDAAHAGIVLVPTAKAQTVRMAGSARADIVIADAGAGALQVHARLRLDGKEVPSGDVIVRALGESGLLCVKAIAQADGPARVPERIALTLAALPSSTPLSTPLRTLLEAPAGITVPAGETDEFLQVAFPHLARHAHVHAGPGIQLPDPDPPLTRLSVRHGPGRTVFYALTIGSLAGPELPWDADNHPDPVDTDAAHARRAALRANVAKVWAASCELDFAASATLRGADAAEFCTAALPALEAMDDVRVSVQGTPAHYRRVDDEPLITVSTLPTTRTDWFDMAVTVTVAGHNVPFRPLFTALSNRRTRLLLADGTYLSLRHPQLDRLRELIDEAGTVAEWQTCPRISRYQISLWSDFEDLADVSEPARAWRERVQGLRDATGPRPAEGATGTPHDPVPVASAIPPVPAPEGLCADLRPYQQAGFEWLVLLWRHRLGGILADDMGLGKTVQALALICHARSGPRRSAPPQPDGEKPRPFLVVAPRSLLDAWRAEAARFAPELRVQVVDATAARRTEAVPAAGIDVVVTSYTILRLDAAAFTAVDWAGVFLDEAQFVKNPATKLYKAVSELSADSVFALTGTPLENSLSDLWALFSLTAPGLFPSARAFRTAYIDPAHAHIPSAKLDTLVAHVKRLHAEGHRALVFSQFTSFLQLAAHRLQAAGIAYAYLDGSTRHRARVIDGFRTGNAPVFLISLKAGGFGLTLTEADYVFVLDPWWNPAAETQAVDRTHRIGQHRRVFVYKMIAAGTIEEKVLALQQRKARLFRSVMDEDGVFARTMTADDIRALLGL